MAPCYSKTKELGERQWGAHLAVVILLSLVSLDGTDDIAGILNHHLTCINVSLTEKPSAMDGRPGT